ncbi:hypothetical protein [Arthrobacter sp. ERGS1:01]|uniref:hypothetical protein n=1 Tax=Arthrobacter sp. ERGS1:01 TaxID=1704044 RepID=UPI000ADEB788|nr:hypothetical protein [Arthrobacter sp. ERGS1:01]
MYNNPVVPVAAGVGSAALAMTGAGQLFWYVLAAFAMVALGMAVKRIIPVRAEKP